MHTPAFRHTLLCHLLRVASSIPASSSSALSERKSAALNWTSFKEKKTYEKKKMDKKNEAPKTGMQIFSKILLVAPEPLVIQSLHYSKRTFIIGIHAIHTSLARCPSLNRHHYLSDKVSKRYWP